MSSAATISKNAAYLAVAELVSKLLQFFIIVYAARMLGAADYGKFSFALAFSMIIIVFFDAGIYTLLVREISRKKEWTGKYLANTIALKVIIGAIVFLCAVIFLESLGFPPENKQAAYVMTLFALFSSYTEIFYSSFRGHEKMGYDAVLKVLRMLMLTGAAFYVLKNSMGVIWFCLMFVIVEAIILLLAYLIQILKFEKLYFEADTKMMKHIFHEAWPFGVSFTFSSIYFYVDSLILSKIRGNAEVGIYNAAYSMAVAILFIPQVYTTSIYPVMFRFFSSKAPKLDFVYKKSFKYLYILGWPISTGVFFLAHDIIRIFFGNEYSSSAIVLQIVAGFILLKFMNSVFGTTLSAIDKQRSRMTAQMWTAIVNVGLNLVLIPFYGFLGAAIATLVTEVFLIYVYYGAISKDMGSIDFMSFAWKPIIASIAMALFLFYTGWGFIPKIVCGSMIYAIVILATKIFDKEDLELMGSVFPRKS